MSGSTLKKLIIHAVSILQFFPAFELKKTQEQNTPFNFINQVGAICMMERRIFLVYIHFVTTSLSAVILMLFQV